MAIKNESTKGEYKEFRKLLRQGIGTRSQKAFAAEAGISYEHLNRMLNNQEINRPTKETLENMAAKMNSVSLNELLEACGYTEFDLAGRVEQVENSLKEVLEAFVHKIKGYRLASLKDELEVIRPLYMKVDGEFSIKEGNDIDLEDIAVGLHNGAEQYCKASYSWECGKAYDCTTYFILFFVTTRSGNVIVTDYAMDAPTLHTFSAVPDTVYENAVRSKKLEACTSVHDLKKDIRMRERLLASIFSVDGRYVTTEVGYGFYFPHTPEGFKEFLTRHAAAFCTTKEKSALCRNVISSGADPDVIFKEYGTENDCGTGTGVVIAEILREETGMEFCYFGTDKYLKGGDDDACVMLEAESGTEEWMSKNLLHVIYEAARELGVPEFGVCYHMATKPKTVMQRYKTEDFHIEYVKRN